MKPVRLLAVLASLALVLGLSACGEEQEAVEPGSFQSVNAQVAETEGIYLDVDELKYQVQASRQLNPLIGEDRDYLQDVASFEADLGSDEVWFGIWMRVENETEEAHRAVEEYVIRDTQENLYRPVRFGRGNVWAYRPVTVPADKLYPIPDTPAGERQPFGTLLLFKVRRESLDNRPLELELTGPESGQKAIVNLDV